MDPNEFFYDKLTPKHVDYISKHWEYLDIDPDVVKKYFRHILTTYDISAGIFTKSDPSYPVSWMTYSDIGHIIAYSTRISKQGFCLCCYCPPFCSGTKRRNCSSWRAICRPCQLMHMLLNLANMLLIPLGEIASLENTTYRLTIYTIQILERTLLHIPGCDYTYVQ